MPSRFVASRWIRSESLTNLGNVTKATLAGVLSQGQVQTWQIPVDASSPMFFSLAYPSGNLDLALTAPSGRRYDPASVQGEANVARE